LQFREENFGMDIISLYDISQISDRCGSRVDTVAVNSEAFNLGTQLFANFICLIEIIKVFPGVKFGDVIISLED